MSDNGLKKQSVGLIGLVGMIYAMTAAGAYGIEDMISSSGPGMTIIMLFPYSACIVRAGLCNS